MKPVYYMCYSDNSNADGLVFPNELLEDTYSPGLWVIELMEFEILPNIFEFDAVDNNELQELKMTRINQDIYQVESVKNGKFYFRIQHLFFRYNKYVGESKLINPRSKLLQVVPLNIQKLDSICLENGFFFVGRGEEF